jgi:hypothetical protein
MHKQSNETQFERETTFGVYPISPLHEQNRREWFSGYQSAMRGEGPPCSLMALRGYAAFNETLKVRAGEIRLSLAKDTRTLWSRLRSELAQTGFVVAVLLSLEQLANDLEGHSCETTQSG